MAAIPFGLQQRDVIGIAETGTGKTAAFLLPMLQYISRLPPMTEQNADKGPYALVMVPARELAQQIEVETMKFARHMGIRVVSIISQGCEVVIATPGRFIDLLKSRYAVLDQCNYVVLHEADRTIDTVIPHNEDEKLDGKRTYRTTYMFSATMPPAESEKFTRLQKLFNELNEKTDSVFTNRKQSSDFLSKNLDKNCYWVTVLHGGKSQEHRETSLQGFRNKRFNFLVAMDVAARGIDIPDVAHVINYDMPGSIEKYTHRIGRTGRTGKTGVATTCLTLHDTDSNNRVPPELARHEPAKFKPRSLSKTSNF
ncbi:hypothetical protein MKX01_031690 [Papaver californicum]|nr:hypothetical protein MKX01_031690 [Papaver californicum]